MKLEVLCMLETLPLSLDNAQVQSHCNIYAQFSAYQRNVVHFTVWQYGLWSFQTGGTKLERFLPKNQHTQRKLLNFENWIN